LLFLALRIKTKICTHKEHLIKQKRLSLPCSSLMSICLHLFEIKQ
jgi:hypothetical protein